MSVPAIHRSTAMQRLASYIIRIRDWMASNRLKLNEEKTQVIWLGTRQQLAGQCRHADPPACDSTVFARCHIPRRHTRSSTVYGL